MRSSTLIYGGLAVFLLCNQAVAESIQINATVNTVSDSPEASLNNTLENIVTGLDGEEQLTGNAAELRNLLGDIQQSDAESATVALFEISPRSNTTIGSFSYKTQYLSNLQTLGKQLSSIHKRNRSFNWRRAQKSFRVNNVESGSLFDNRFNTFFSAEQVNSEQTETDYEAGFDGSVQKISVGADYRMSTALYSGAIFSYFNADLDINDNGGSLGATNQSIMAYANYYINNEVSVSGVMRAGTYQYDLSRKILYTANNQNIDRTASSSPDGRFYAAQASVNYNRSIAKGLSAGVNVDVDLVDSQTQSFNETGAGGLNLHVDTFDTQKLSLTLGAQTSYVASTSWAVLTPFLGLNWIFDVMEEDQVLKAHFNNDPNKTPFQFQIQDDDNNYVHLNLGTGAVFARGFSAFLQFDGLFLRDNYNQNLLSLGVRKEL